MKILFLTSGGQSYGESPSEHLAKFIDNNNDDISIDMYSLRFVPVPQDIDLRQYDLVWGDMDGGGSLPKARRLAKKAALPCYLHGEWIPPYRVEEGWEEEFNERTDLTRIHTYLENLEAMKTADLVSLAVGKTAGGFDFIKDKFGIEFDNAFLRYPACPEYLPIEAEKTNSVATIARANDGKKRVDHTIKAIERSNTKPKFVLIGGEIGMTHPTIEIDSKGSWNSYNKVKIFAESKIAVQHWSGIPPAEAIQQKCVVLSYDIPYMRELYGDALIWVEKDNIDALAEAIDKWIWNDDLRQEHAEKAYHMFVNGELGVKTQKDRAELVTKHLRELLRQS
tara:strand:- start:676 stop:1686 length:1011 start_codon:yes stop_codon:yes gene_type:complete